MQYLKLVKVAFGISNLCILLMISGSAEYHTDSRMPCVALHHLPKTHRLDRGGASLSSRGRGSHRLVPPQTFSFGSRTGEAVSPLLKQARLTLHGSSDTHFLFFFFALKWHNFKMRHGNTRVNEALGPGV